MEANPEPNIEQTLQELSVAIDPCKSIGTQLSSQNTTS
jgi:hypothetical protein